MFKEGFKKEENEPKDFKKAHKCGYIIQLHYLNLIANTTSYQIICLMPHHAVVICISDTNKAGPTTYGKLSRARMSKPTIEKT